MPLELLERARHLDALDGWLRETAGGSGRLVFIGGEAGIGKTTLVDRFSQLARGRARVLRGACDALSTPRPLGPLFDVAGSVGGELERLLNDGVARDRVFRAMLAELGTTITPALVIIEDAHWADDATLDLLRFLGRRLEHARALIVVTYRDDEIGTGHPLRLVIGDLVTTKTVRRLTLESFSEDATRILAMESDFDPVSLHRLTSGNPFYLTEILAAGGTIPVSIRDSVLARTNRLPAEARSVIEAAAAIGQIVPIDLLAAVSESAPEAIDACLHAGVLVANGNDLAFRHEIVRETVLGTLLPIRRRTIHKRILQHLLEHPDLVASPARLAHHADEAGDREAVLKFATLAALQAAALSSNREAANQYARALRYATDSDVETRDALLNGYAEAANLCGRSSDSLVARTELINMARDAGNSEQEAAQLRSLASTLVTSGRNDEAEQAIQSALAISDRLPESLLHGSIFSTVSQLRMLNRDTVEAVFWGERALKLAEQTNDTRTIVSTLNSMGSALITSGDEQSGEALLLRGLELAKSTGYYLGAALIFTNLGSGFGEVHRFELAERYLLAAIEYTAEYDFDALYSYNTAWLALTRLAQGQWTQATDLANTVLRTPSAQAISRIMAFVALGRVRSRRGDPQYQEPLDQALALAAPTGTLQRIAPVRAARAEAAWLAGDAATTLTEAQAAFGISLTHGHAWFTGELAYWQSVSGSPPTGDFEAAKPYMLQITGDWQTASSAWENRGCPYEAARALEDSQDETALRRALETFEELGARPAAAVVSRKLRALGARNIPRGPRESTRANPANLTTRELEILPHLSAGLRNSEIAERLFLSPKTVDHHVSNILGKLGVRSRNDVSAAADRLELHAFLNQDRESDSAI